MDDGIVDDGGALGSLRGGVARSEITADAAGAKVHDPLYAKALVLDDGGGLLLGIIVDRNDGDESPVPGDTRKKGAPWKIESVQLEVSGVTLPPQD